MVPLNKLPKLASMVDDSMPTRPSDYADPTHQRWPCHSGPATILSWAQFLQSPDAGDAGVQSQFYKKASQHGVLPELFETSTAVKQALEQSGQAQNYAIDATIDGNRHRRMPLDNDLQIRASIGFFKDNRLDWPWPMRKTAAKRLLCAAKTHKVRIDNATRDLLCKTAGLGACGKPDVLGLIETRRQAVRRSTSRDEVRQVLDSLAKQAGEIAEEEVPQYLDKTASVIDGVDRMLHLDRQYGRGLAAPEETLFAITADQLDSIKLVKVAGCTYDRADILDAEGTWNKIASSVDELVKVGESNPDLVRSILEAARVEPV